MKTKTQAAAPRGRPATGKTPQRQIRISDGEWQEYLALAESAGVTVSEWIRAELRGAAKRDARRAG